MDEILKRQLKLKKKIKYNENIIKKGITIFGNAPYFDNILKLKAELKGINFVLKQLKNEN